jgi:thioredoxin-like negative regulator of GroEL
VIQERASQSLARGNYDAARIGFERTLEHNPADPLASMGLAITLRHLGESDAAATILARLAPLGEHDGNGFAPAHLLLAQELLSGPQPEAGAVATAQAHLARIVRVDPNHPAANAMLAMIYLNTGRWDQCRDALQHCMGYVDDKGLEIARLCFAHGDRQQGRIWARRAVAFYQLRYEHNPQDEVSRLQLCRAEAAAGDGPLAADGLWNAWRQTRHEAFRAELLQMYQALEASGEMLGKYADRESRERQLRAPG